MQEEPPEDVTLEESIWAVVILAGTDPMGRAASFMLGFLFVANICAQGLFVYLLETTSLTKSVYNPELVTQYRTWRRNEAHSVANCALAGVDSTAIDLASLPTTNAPLATP